MLTCYYVIIIIVMCLQNLCFYVFQISNLLPEFQNEASWYSILKEMSLSASA